VLFWEIRFGKLKDGKLKDGNVEIEIVFSEKKKTLTDIMNGAKVTEKVLPKIEFFGRVIAPGKYSHTIILPNHSFKAFKVK